MQKPVSNFCFHFDLDRLMLLNPPSPLCPCGDTPQNACDSPPNLREEWSPNDDPPPPPPGPPLRTMISLQTLLKLQGS